MIKVADRKLFKICEKWYNEGKQHRHNKHLLTPYQMSLLLYCYSQLKKDETAEFIDSEVSEVLTKCGYEVVKKGIGYMAKKNQLPPTDRV